MRIELAPRRLGEEPDHQSQQEAGKSGDIKRKPPSHRRPEFTSQQIARRGTDGNCEIKNPKNAAAFVFRKKIRDKRWRDGHKCRFAHTDQGMPQQQFSVGVSHRRHQRQATPEHRPQHDDQLARVAIGERSDEWRGHHVEHQKRAGEISNLGVAEVKFALHQRLHRKQYRPVDVVEKVQRRQEYERGPGIEFARSHLAKEYNMVNGDLRTWESAPWTRYVCTDVLQDVAKERLYDESPAKLLPLGQV